jgi:hypothetical protein
MKAQAEQKKGTQNSPVNGKKFAQTCFIRVNPKNLVKKKGIGTKRQISSTPASGDFLFGKELEGRKVEKT